MRMLSLTVLIAVGLTTADFLDDFESYTPGQDPDTHFNWTREPAGGHVLVAAQGDNQVVEAFFTDSAYIAYLCPGAGFWEDGSVSMDFSPSGNGSFVNVFARMQLLTGEGYVGGVVMTLQPFTFSYIGYIDLTGGYELLHYGYGPSVPPGEWFNLRLELEGQDPVILTLFADDQEIAQAVDSQYLLGPGLSGFALLYEMETPTVFADNFHVVLSPQAMVSATFGSIKAMFR